jgi:hypothetical protein
MEQLKSATGKSIPVYEFKKNSRKEIQEPKVSRLLPNVCYFQKETHTQSYGFNNL